MHAAGVLARFCPPKPASTRSPQNKPRKNSLRGKGRGEFLAEFRRSARPGGQVEALAVREVLGPVVASGAGTVSSETRAGLEIE